MSAISELMHAHPEEQAILKRGNLWAGSADQDPNLDAQDALEVLLGLPRDAPLFALKMLTLEVRLWYEIKNDDQRRLLRRLYRLHAEWLDSIGQWPQSNVYALRSSLLGNGR